MPSEIHIAVSSLTLTGKSPEEIISISQKENYILEFSSGMPYRKDMEEIFLSAPVKKLPHNYFPAPEKSFVLNLASMNDEIRNRSIEHCINGLRLASLANAPFFSAHAGFCIDPNPSELGKQIKQQVNVDKNKNWKLFFESVKTILKESEKYKADFLIENNVIAAMNVYEDGTNPLFCCDDSEMINLINEINNPRLGILLDTGHIKVSSNTLKFSLDACVFKIKPFVKCIHHSDNDGIFDTNQQIDEKYWFWKYIKGFSGIYPVGNNSYGIYHVLEVKNQTVEQINHQLSLIRNNILN